MQKVTALLAIFDIESNGNEVNFISSIFLITIFEGRKKDDLHRIGIGDLSNRDFGVTFTIHYEIALTK